MGRGDPSPEGEDLRRAVRWISERGDHSRAAVEEACTRFDLSPRDADFLLRHFVTRSDERDAGCATDAGRD